MAWACVKNGSYSACKNSPDLDSGGTKEKGVSKNNIEENDTGKMRSAYIGWENAVRSAQDRAAWRDLVEAFKCATGHDEDE